MLNTVFKVCSLFTKIECFASLIYNYDNCIAIFNYFRKLFVDESILFDMEMICSILRITNKDFSSF